MKRIIPLFLSLAVAAACGREVVDLSGTWRIRLENGQDTSITLPGTTDLAGLGFPAPEDGDPETLHLTRRHSYTGTAVYTRDIVIPRSWRNRDVTLLLERTKPSEVYLDGRFIGSSDAVSTPQRYNLGRTGAGKHELRIAVDNAGGVPPQVIRSSHMYSADTQTNWNGIIGRIELRTGRERPARKAVKTFRSEGMHFRDADSLVFLRGRHDGCVFPLTGFPPMGKEGWDRYFAILAEYGLNHVRFHSWCPPEACFTAADEAGFYLQPELPFWGTLDPADTLLVDYLTAEGERIIKEYGHHRSFVLFSLGNELWGPLETMEGLCAHFRQMDSTILYTFGTNFYLGQTGSRPGMDFYSTVRTGGDAQDYSTHVRGSFSFADVDEGGWLNRCYPGTDADFDVACGRSDVPVISHESGQFQSYPDYGQTAKYTGVLRPDNLLEFRRRLEAAGLGDYAEDYSAASGAWAAQLYKADIEMDLRSGDMAGFQLLDLVDYPGQGSAYIGMLDAFMDSKGFISSEEWRQFCSPVVLLAEFPRYTWTADERFTAAVKVADYSSRPLTGQIAWRLEKMASKPGEEPHTAASGTIGLKEKGKGLVFADSLRIPLGSLEVPSKYMLELSLGNIRNSWSLWIYPPAHIQDGAISDAAGTAGLVIADCLTPELEAAAEEGARVLCFGLSEDYGAETLEPLFTSDFWNYGMFKEISEMNGRPVSPGTLGLSIDASHPIFGSFPTDSYTSWQWFPVLKAGRPVVMDPDSPRVCKGWQILSRPIDNPERNHSLALIAEKRVGQGLIVLCASDLRQQSYPESRQLLESILEYMGKNN